MTRTNPGYKTQGTMDTSENNARSFVQSVGRFIDQRKLLAPSEHVLAAVSGGADSVAMLAVLLELAQQRGRDYRLSVAHLDHALREDSAADADFVESLAGSLSLACIRERVDVREAALGGESIEEAARRIRYDFLTRAAEQAGATKVAMGHHADDQVETVLYRILRGTHLRGLAGMPARRMLSQDVTLVRPMLCASRGEIVDYLRFRGLAWRDDPSNLDPAYRRNFIRHKLLPLLREEVNPRCDQALLRLASAAGDAEILLAGQAEALLARARRPAGQGAIALDAPALAEADELVRQVALRRAMEQAGLPLQAVGAEQIQRLSDLVAGPGASGPVNLPGGWIARREKALLIVEPSIPLVAEPSWPAVPLACPGRTLLPDGRSVDCQILAFAPADFDLHCRTRPAGVEMIDADRIVGPLRCRPRETGDAFVPLGCGGRQTVSDLLTNLKWPAAARREVLCICDDQGIVYVHPARIDARVRITDSTRRVLRLSLRTPPPPDADEDS
ncbi:MAG: tRNA lysidine(34) synthetase TilS [Phycisphaerae bacterium]